MKFVLTAIIICFSISMQSQQKYDWNRYNQLPFDTTWDSHFAVLEIEKSVLPSITKSDANIEIRYYWHGHLGRAVILVLQCFNETISVQRFSRSMSEIKRPFKQSDSLFYSEGGSYYDWKIEKLKTLRNGDSIIQELITNGLLTINRSDSIKQKLLEKYSTIKQNDTSYLELKTDIQEKPRAAFSIKLNNRFRTFIPTIVVYTDNRANRDTVFWGDGLINAFKKIFATATVQKTIYKPNIKQY
jgi:hypothetical protein